MTNKNLNKIWILKSKGSESSFGGNLGYPDKPNAYYIYDNYVKNYNKIAVGDAIVIVDKEYIIGYATIKKIVAQKNVNKIRYLCPYPGCKTSEHYQRKSKMPKYKCRKKHEFEKPIEEKITATQFTAHYAQTFIPAKPRTSIKILEPYYIKRNRYYSIQPASASFYVEYPYLSIKDREYSILVQGPNPLFPFDSFGEYTPTQNDDRNSVLKNVKQRKDQKKFKDSLIEAYGCYCMITGISIPAVIEASHICPYLGEKDNHVKNGLLLRSDLHTLFDNDLLGIDPYSLQVEIHPQIRNSYYSIYNGSLLRLLDVKRSPSINALKTRWEVFKKTF